MTSKDEPYIRITFGYNDAFILPYKDGIALMGHLKEAEKYDTSDYHNPKIVPLKEYPTIHIITNEEYKKLKMMNVLLPEKATDSD